MYPKKTADLEVIFAVKLVSRLVMFFYINTHFCLSKMSVDSLKVALL